MIRPLHQALVVGTVIHPEHMAEFMGRNLDEPLKHPTLLLFLALKFLLGEIGTESSNALNPSKCGDAISETVITQAFREQVYVGQ